MSRQTQADKSLDKYINNLINNTKEWEPMVLACLDASPDALQIASGHLCVHAITQRRVLEFEHRPYNALYLAIELYYNSVSSTGKEYKPAPLPVIGSFLTYLCSQPEPCGINSSEIQTALDTLKGIRESIDGVGNLPLFELGFSKWLHKIRIITMVDNTGQTPNWAPEDMVSAFNSIVDTLPSTSTEKRDYTLGELYVKEDEQVERLRTGIFDLDNVLGGGFVKGSGACVLAPSGGGKTVAACQLATAMINHNGLDVCGALISTEQKPTELLPRMAACNLGIPFEGMETGIVREHLTPSAAEKVDDMMRKFGKRLQIHRWEKKSGATSFYTDMEVLIRKYIKQMGRLDFIVFDWLGASLNGKISDKPDQLRIIYKMAADALNDLADKYNLVIIYFGQADTKSSVGKKHITPSDARECKDLHFNATVFWGISALKTTDKRGRDDDPDKKSNDTYHVEQYWAFDKVRMGKPKILTVRRDFGFQRFAFESDNKAKLRI